MSSSSTISVIISSLSPVSYFNDSLEMTLEQRSVFSHHQINSNTPHFFCFSKYFLLKYFSTSWTHLACCKSVLLLSPPQNIPAICLTLTSDNAGQLLSRVLFDMNHMKYVNIHRWYWSDTRVQTWLSPGHWSHRQFSRSVLLRWNIVNTSQHPGHREQYKMTKRRPK